MKEEKEIRQFFVVEFDLLDMRMSILAENVRFFIFYPAEDKSGFEKIHDDDKYGLSLY